MEVEDLELANLLRIGKVRLAIENLDAELFLQTQLGDLLRTVNQLVSTVNLGLGLAFAPAYSFNVAVAAWHNYLELRQRWFELPIKFFEGWEQPQLPAIANRPALPQA